MKNRELYVKDPGAMRLLNNGVAEGIAKHLDGRVLLVGTGQSGVHDTPLLQKIAGRFPTRLCLSDTDADTVTEHLQATQNEKPVLARQLDQSKIGPVVFRVESRPLTAKEKIRLRTLFQTVGIPCKPNAAV